MKLKLIRGGKPEHEILACAVCNGTTFIPTVVGCIAIEDIEEGLDIIGGTDQMICAQCLANGTVEPIV